LKQANTFVLLKILEKSTIHNPLQNKDRVDVDRKMVKETQTERQTERQEDEERKREREKER
jgi:hypothetical protein